MVSKLPIIWKQIRAGDASLRRPDVSHSALRKSKVRIIRHARTHSVGTYQSCMFDNVRMNWCQREALQKFSETSWSDIHAVFKIEFTSCVNADFDEVCRSSKVQ